LVMQMNCEAIQDLLYMYPGMDQEAIHPCRQGAQLVDEAELVLSSGRFQLAGQTIPDPHGNFYLANDIVVRNIDVAVEADEMQYGLRRTEDPFTLVLVIAPTAGFATVDHWSVLILRLQILVFHQGLLSSSRHDVIDPTLADRYPIQVFQPRLGTHITQMLFLAVIDHRDFQVCPIAPHHFQPSRRFTEDRSLAIRTGASILTLFNDSPRLAGSSVTWVIVVRSCLPSFSHVA